MHRCASGAMSSGCIAGKCSRQSSVVSAAGRCRLDEEPIPADLADAFPSLKIETRVPGGEKQRRPKKNGMRKSHSIALQGACPTGCFQLHRAAANEPRKRNGHVSVPVSCSRKRSNAISTPRWTACVSETVQMPDRAARCRATAENRVPGLPREGSKGSS